MLADDFQKLADLVRRYVGRAAIGVGHRSLQRIGDVGAIPLLDELGGFELKHPIECRGG